MQKDGGCAERWWLCRKMVAVCRKIATECNTARSNTRWWQCMPKDGGWMPKDGVCRLIIFIFLSHGQTATYIYTIINVRAYAVENRTT